MEWAFQERPPRITSASISMCRPLTSGTLLIHARTHASTHARTHVNTHTHTCTCQERFFARTLRRERERERERDRARARERERGGGERERERATSKREREREREIEIRVRQRDRLGWHLCMIETEAALLFWPAMKMSALYSPDGVSCQLSIGP